MGSDPDDISRPAEAAGLSDDALAEINRLWTIVRAQSNTAHEVNNALQIIAGSAELLQAKFLDPVVGRRVDAIRSQAERAASRIQHLVGYARAESLPPQIADVWAIVEEAIAMRALSASRRRLRIVVDREDARPCHGFVDPVRTRQALVNLLLAAEDTLADRVNARITIGIEDEGEWIVVTVAAQGETPTAGEPGAAADPAAAALTHGAQLWAADRLARSQRGRVTATDTPDGRVARLRLPPAGVAPV